jgi:methyl-accepting chemotaxis protein
MSMIHARVDALELVARPLAHETRMVSLQVERMYKCFQYQDRISQMMTLLHEDIERLRAAMTAPDLKLDELGPDKWLERLESQYVMAEQHQQHAGLVGKLHASPDDEDTTFF